MMTTDARPPPFATGGSTYVAEVEFRPHGRRYLVDTGRRVPRAVAAAFQVVQPGRARRRDRLADQLRASVKMREFTRGRPVPATGSTSHCHARRVGHGRGGRVERQQGTTRRTDRPVTAPAPAAVPVTDGHCVVDGAAFKVRPRSLGNRRQDFNAEGRLDDAPARSAASARSTRRPWSRARGGSDQRPGVRLRAE